MCRQCVSDAIAQYALLPHKVVEVTRALLRAYLVDENVEEGAVLEDFDAVAFDRRAVG